MWRKFVFFLISGITLVVPMSRYIFFKVQGIYRCHKKIISTSLNGSFQVYTKSYQITFHIHCNAFFVHSSGKGFCLILILTTEVDLRTVREKQLINAVGLNGLYKNISAGWGSILTTPNYFCINHRKQRVFPQFAIIINGLASSFRFIWISRRVDIWK